MLQSIGLTRIPTDSQNRKSATEPPSFVYSSRELCPPHLIIQQLRRAHALFLLHHDFTLDGLYQRVGRTTLCARLERFWGKFAWNWEALLNGNPAVDIYDGIKLSAGGELGIGVGEEEWGSGEREVLEDFVSRTDGLVDMIVSRFGDPPTQVEDKAAGDIGTPWLGFGAYPRSSDGVIFSGVGGISRPSVVRISQWMEWIYRYGDNAYGVGQDPTSPRRRKQRRKQRGRLYSKGASILSNARSPSESLDPDRSFSPGIPRPLVVGTPPPERRASPQTIKEDSPARSEHQESDWSSLRPETFMKYLTLGYGTSWFSSSPHPLVSTSKQNDGLENAGQEDTRQVAEEETQSKPKVQERGRFIVGLREGEDPSGHSPESYTEGRQNGRLEPRITHVHLVGPEQERKGLQAVVYLVCKSSSLLKAVIANVVSINHSSSHSSSIPKRRLYQNLPYTTPSVTNYTPFTRHSQTPLPPQQQQPGYPFLKMNQPPINNNQSTTSSTTPRT